MYKIFETVDEASDYTARRLLERIQAKPEAVLGLATGAPWSRSMPGWWRGCGAIPWISHG